ncbi:phage portal protein [Enterobacter mori]|uniref:phage portal protein n=1 Tax=Enterobacter mori TaxID=539813 RepID=UPI003969F059
MGIGAIRACVTLLAESIAQLPVELYQRDEKGGRRRATDHPLYDVIHSQPNRKDTSFEYYEQQQGVLGLEGNSYATFNNVTVRGSIYATNGNFSFNGSGNTTVINGNGVTINIPGGGRIVLGTWS